MGKFMLVEQDETIVTRMKLEHYFATIHTLNNIEDITQEVWREDKEILSDIRFELTIWKKRKAGE